MVFSVPSALPEELYAWENRMTRFEKELCPLETDMTLLVQVRANHASQLFGILRRGVVGQRVLYGALEALQRLLRRAWAMSWGAIVEAACLSCSP